METIDKTKSRQRQRYQKRRKEKIEYTKKWNAENKDKMKQYQKKYQRKISDRLSKYNSEINKNKREADVGFRNKCFLMSLHTQFLNGTNTYFSKYIDNMSLEAYKKYIESKWCKLRIL